MIKAVIATITILIVCTTFFAFKSVRNENLYIQSVSDLKESISKVEQLESKYSTLEASYKTVNDQLINEQVTQVKLRDENAQLDKQLFDYREKLKVLEREDESYRIWANGSLPLSIIGMLNKERDK